MPATLTGPAAVARYLARRQAPGPWRLAGDCGRDYAGAVVIPALAERATLPATLAGLAANPLRELSRWLVVVVVNNRVNAGTAERDDNRRLRSWLAAGQAPPALRLAWVDAAAPGLELPRGEGVGLARKIGCDLALERLDWSGASPLLAMLDADTLVDSAYLPALAGHFSTAAAGAAVLPFVHQAGATAAIDAAITRYELYLRGHLLGLTLAGSPYAFHTIGSTIACRGEAYLRAGGMNRRQAGEDFYFLQQLAKTCGVETLAGTLVQPSARPSPRVPFGTGPSVREQLAGHGKIITCHAAAAYRVLATWLALAAATGPETPGERLLQQAMAAAPELGRFLAEEKLATVWDRLRATHRRASHLGRAFHGWFDALKTYRLLRYLGTAGRPPGPPETALPPLLDWAGLEPATEPGRQLALLRHIQNRPGDRPAGRG